MKRRTIWVALTSAVLTLTLLAGPPSVAAATTASAPESWEDACKVDGLDFAPVLKTDKRNDGSAIKPAPSAAGTYVPVIYVHGWISSSKNVANKGVFSAVPDLSTKRAGGKPSNDRSLIGNVQDLPGAAVFTFDYERYASRWVTNEKIGPSLARAIECLNERSGEKVIVVGHSMGGLATRQALSESPGLEDKISQVITFGTPNTGSVAAALLAVGLDAAASSGRLIPQTKAVALLRAWMAHCGKVKTADMLKPSLLCPTLLPAPLTAFDSEAAIALRAWSQELKALPQWPEGLPVHALAGETRFETTSGGLFRQKKKESFGLGDVIVDQGSALAGSTDSRSATCTYDLNPTANIGDASLVNVWKIRTLDEVSRNSADLFKESIPCFHGNLMRETSLVLEQFMHIASDLESRTPPTDIVTVLPWSDGRSENVRETIAGDDIGGTCSSSELAYREDGFRCFAGNGVYDPCFSSPEDQSTLVCVLHEYDVKLVDMTVKTEFSPDISPKDGSAFRVELHDGSVCSRSSGSGPHGSEEYPYWFGYCVGDTEGVWRARETNEDPLWTLYDRNEAGTYFVAIGPEDPEEPILLHPVKTAYR